jgi:Protein of unknown function (DUF3632)
LNLTSFIARLIGVGLINPLNFALWELRDALETKIDSKEMVSCKVSAASEWIIRCGKRLYKETLQRDVERLDAMQRDEAVPKGGPLYNGRPGFCRERWQFWKRRFSKVKGEVDEAAAKMALEAVSAMERIEKDEEEA